MKKRIVVALGGNALGNTLPEQMEAVQITARAIADLVADGHELVLCHGNGPQVGMINLAFETATEPSVERVPLSVAVAMSQGYIGYDIQNALGRELLNRGIHKAVVTFITQVVVKEDDPAFESPTKPIGAFYTRQQAEQIQREKPSFVMREDAGRGWRRVVASPRPVDVVEKEAVLSMLEAGHLVVACGGGGIPVVQRADNFLQGVSAVIDKDLAAERLAEIINADLLVILTAVEKVAINFNKPGEQWLGHMSVAEAEAYMGEGHFAKGSMLPKVQAAVQFAKSKPGRQVLITTLTKAKQGLAGETGTMVTG